MPMPSCEDGEREEDGGDNGGGGPCPPSMGNLARSNIIRDNSQKMAQNKLNVY